MTNKQKILKFFIVLIVISAVLIVYKLSTTPSSYKVMDFKESYADIIDLGPKENGIEIPIELETDSEILFHIENSSTGRAILEKKIDDTWSEIKVSDKSNIYGFRFFAEKGSYRIKAGPFHNPYLEYGVTPRDSKPAYGKEQARLIKSTKYVSNWFTNAEPQSHWYKVEIPKEKEVSLVFFTSQNWEEFAFHVKIYNTAGSVLYETELIEDLNPNENPEDMFQGILPKGIYYIEIAKSNPNSSGGYGIGYEK